LRKQTSTKLLYVGPGSIEMGNHLGTQADSTSDSEHEEKRVPVNVQGCSMAGELGGYG